jgi:hypothetical protein
VLKADLGADGSKTLTAQITDAAGNAGTASTGVSFTLETTIEKLVNATLASTLNQGLTDTYGGWVLHQTASVNLYDYSYDDDGNQINPVFRRTAYNVEFDSGYILFTGAGTPSGGAASQTMSNLIAGQTYKVQYELTVSDTRAHTVGVKVLEGSVWNAAATELGSQSSTKTTSGSTFYSFNFTASSSTATLVFTNTGATPNDSDLFLQQASVMTTSDAALYPATPLLLDLNGDGLKTVGLAQGVLFDVSNSGRLSHVGWTNANDGMLVRDLNQDGTINNGAELFGNGTLLADGSHAANGFDALAQFDDNHDGQIDAQDAVFQELQVWRDANGDGVSQGDELLDLQDLGIASFNLSAAQGNAVHNGNVYGLLSNYTTTDGAVHELTDVWFAQGAKLTLDTDASGLNYLHLATNSPALDLCAVDTSRLQGVNVIDMLSNQTADSLRLDLQQVVDLSLESGVKSTTSGLVGSGKNVAGNETSYQLMLFGDAQDTVQIGTGWTNSGTVVNYAGHDLVVYNSNTSAVQLLIDQAMVNANHVVI